MYEAVIFCQAPADIPYVLELYQQLKGTKIISIIVVNVEGMFRYLKDLDLDLERLVFIPYSLINLKQIVKLYSERKRISFLWNLHFSKIEYADVYFFSRFEDWLTASFIHRFSEKSDIHLLYIDHYDSSGDLFTSNKTISLKMRMYLWILKYLTKVDFKIEIREKIPEFPVCNYPIVKVELKVGNQIYSRYAYNIEMSYTNSPFLLFFCSPCDFTIFNPDHYDDTLTSILVVLKSVGYKIVVKGHPRLGLPEIVKSKADIEIPSFIPGELINPENFKICIGIDTTAICYYARNCIIPTYSVIGIFSSANNSMFNSIKGYLEQQSDNKILFLNSLEDLVKVTAKHL